MSLNGADSQSVPRGSSPDPEHGRQVYLRSCANCHGDDGKNIVGFDLSTIASRMSFEQLVEWLKHPTAPMPAVFPEPLDKDEELNILDAAAYLTQHGTAP
jgi:mono/diheme cytochrome c family protein